MDLGDVPVRMQHAADFVKQDISTIRTGKATPSLVENVVISAYGGSTKMRVVELGTISIPDAQSLVITPYDPSIIGEIRRDIEAANLGLTPMIDREVVRISIPPLTGERRQEFVKLLHRKLEDGRVKVRQVRHDKMSELKRGFEEKTVGEDDRERLEKELQDLTDKVINQIETMGATKEKEILNV
jgi:ribosome recycling factor